MSHTTLIKYGTVMCLLILAFSMELPAAFADFNATPSQTCNYYDIFYLQVYSTTLGFGFDYTGSAITWYTPQANMQWQISKASWLVWFWLSGQNEGYFIYNPNWSMTGWGTGTTNFGIPTWWGTIGVTQNFDTEIPFLGSGSWGPASCGTSYIS
jgi:hypothetical protein